MAASTKWRINISESNGTIAIAEVEMRGEPGGSDLCSGGTATASAVYVTKYADLAFDNIISSSSYWQAGSTSVLTGWLQYEFASAVEIVEYAIVRGPSASYSPKSWTFEHWDGAAWKVADTRSGQTTWNASQYYVFSVPEQRPQATLSAWTSLTPRAFKIIHDRWAWTVFSLVLIPESNSAWIDQPTVVSRFVSVDPFSWIDNTIITASSVATSIDFSWKDIPPASLWYLPFATPERQVFVCVLKKDGLADVEIPITSMQLRRRDGDPTSISCIIPDALTYYDYANDRIDGEIVILSGSLTEDGTRHLSELERVVLDSVKYDIGVLSSSMTISGYKTTQNINPRPITISNITYRGLQADGKYRIRGKINIFLRPGDMAFFGVNFIVVDQIYIWISPTNAWMEIAGS